MQGDDPRYWKTVATAKHFAVHSGPEAERHAFDAPAERARSRRHLPAAVRGGRARGTRRLGDGRLQPRRRRAGRGQPDAARARRCARRGASTATWWATAARSTTSSRSTTRRRHRAAAAAAAALRAGTDLDCGRGLPARSARRWRGASSAEADLESGGGAALRRALPPGPVRSARAHAPGRRWAPRAIDSPAHLRDWPATAARAASCCSRTEAARCRSAARSSGLAVVGPTADDLPVLLANYHGTPSHPVTLLEGHPRRGARPAASTVGYAPRRPTLVDATLRARARRGGRRRARRRRRRSPSSGLDPRLEGEERDSAPQPAPAIAATWSAARRSSGCSRRVRRDGQAGGRRAHRRQRAGGPLGGGARRRACSTPGTRARRAAPRSPTCCSATSTRPAACRSRSTARPPICRPFADYAMRGPHLPLLRTASRSIRFGDGLSYTTFRYAEPGRRRGRRRGGLRRRREHRHARRRRGGRGLRRAARPARLRARAAGWPPSRASTLAAGERRRIALPLRPTR